MKYLCLVYLEPDKFTAVPDRECFDCGEDLRKRGLLLSAEPLFKGDTAKTVRVRDGRVAITDGPFAETKEQLAGFYLIDAASEDLRAISLDIHAHPELNFEEVHAHQC